MTSVGGQPVVHLGQGILGRTEEICRQARNDKVGSVRIARCNRRRARHAHPHGTTKEETMMTALHISSEWERPALPTGDGAATLMIRIVAPVMPERAPASRPSVDLAFVIDRSGSMAGRPIELAKQAVSQAAGMLDRRDRAARVVYDDHIDVIHPVVPVEAHTRNELRLGWAQVDARGSTNLCD